MMINFVGRWYYRPTFVPLIVSRKTAEVRLTKLHRVQPAVDVEYEVHLERLGLAVQPAHCYRNTQLSIRYVPADCPAWYKLTNNRSAIGQRGWRVGKFGQERANRLTRVEKKTLYIRRPINVEEQRQRKSLYVRVSSRRSQSSMYRFRIKLFVVYKNLWKNKK